MAQLHASFSSASVASSMSVNPIAAARRAFSPTVISAIERAGSHVRGTDRVINHGRQEMYQTSPTAGSPRQLISTTVGVLWRK